MVVKTGLKLRGGAAIGVGDESRRRAVRARAVGVAGEHALDDRRQPQFRLGDGGVDGVAGAGVGEL